MPTIVLNVDPRQPESEAIGRAAAILRRGGLVAFPTETVYGLGANALDAVAVAGIFATKGRPATNPVIVRVASVQEAQKLITHWPDFAEKLASRFWPGPLSLVLPKKACVPDVVTAGGRTVAIRVPAHPVAQALVRAAGVPIAAPSANRSNYLSPTTAAHVLAGLQDRLDLVLDGGLCPGGLESTVLDLTTTPPRLLRPGLVTPQQLEAAIGLIARPDSQSLEGPLPSPGMLSRHYAPRAVLEVAESKGRERAMELWNQGLRVGRVTWQGETSDPGILTLELPKEPEGYASLFYAALHTLDVAGTQHIVIDQPPQTDEWLAVRDRLQRASTGGFP